MSHLAVQIAESVKSSGVQTAYGDPVELDGVSVIPVALVQFGFGAGTADEGGADAEGPSGGGGGGTSIPIGAYIRDEEGVRFEPNLVSLLAVAIPFVWVTGKALARIVKVLKK